MEHVERSAAMFNQSLSVSNSVKLIRFFKVVGLLGGMVWLSRILIVVAILGGTLFLMS